MAGAGATCATRAERRDGYWLVRADGAPATGPGPAGAGGPASADGSASAERRAVRDGVPAGAGGPVDDGGWEHSERALAQRYLAGPEWERYRRLTGAARRDWLLGRVAVKDAVRDWLGDRGAGRLDPADVQVWNEPGGRPGVTVPGGERLAVSIAHRAGVAVAAVAEGGVPDRRAEASTAGAAGIDVELIEPRSPTFVGLMMTDGERRLGEGRPADEWVTAAWAAKEAVAKAAGTGLQGRPKDWVVEAADGDWLLVAGNWVRTAREGDHVVAVVARCGPAPA